MHDGVLDITMKHADGVAVAILSGEVDMATAPAVVDRVRDVLRQGTTRVCIDLTDVLHLDSSGIAALVNVRRYTIRSDGSLVLVCPQGRLLELLELTGLARYFQIVRSRGDAMQVLA
jgi:anti-sigma B factor antagonist